MAAQAGYGDSLTFVNLVVSTNGTVHRVKGPRKRNAQRKILMRKSKTKGESDDGKV